MTNEPSQLPSRLITDGKRDSIHRALLTGLLGNIATKTDKHEFTAARNVKISIHPGSGLFKNQPQWIMAAEIVETTRLYARTCARIQPLWIERAGRHLLKHSYSDPRWNEHGHHVNADEKTTLFGLVIVPRRVVNYGPIDPKISRQVFILHALIEGRFKTAAPFFSKNLRLMEEVRGYEAKARRRDLLLDGQQLFSFYDSKVPADVFDGPSFEKWFRHAEQHHRHQLQFSMRDVLVENAPEISPQQFPDFTIVEGNRFALSYKFEPTDPADGVSVAVPLAILNQLPVHAFDWLVPGWLHEKAVALMRTLPREIRTKLVPAPEFAAKALAQLRFGEGGFLASLADRLGNFAGEVIPPSAFRHDQIPLNLQMNIRVIDEAGKTLAASRDLAELREKLAGVTRDAFKDLPRSPFNRDNLSRWDFGDLPESVSVRKPGITVLAYPALVEDGQKVHLRLLDSLEAAAKEMRGGMRRLFMQQLSSEFKYLSKNLNGFNQSALYYASIGPADALRQSMLSAIADQGFFAENTNIVRKQDEFANRAAAAWKRIPAAADEIADIASQTLSAYHAVAKIIERDKLEAHQLAIKDVREQLAAMLPRDFLLTVPPAWRAHLPRFLRAAEMRLNKMKSWGSAKDGQLMAQVRPLILQYRDRVTRKPATAAKPEMIQYRWMIEELRVSLFAQELKTSVPVSVQRLEKLWSAIRE